MEKQKKPDAEPELCAEPELESESESDSGFVVEVGLRAAIGAEGHWNRKPPFPQV